MNDVKFDKSFVELGLMDEATRREELELVQNAAFTDPEDSSAWYYHKWLLLGGKSEDSLNTHLTMVAIDHDKKQLMLAFSNLVKGPESCKIVRYDTVFFSFLFVHQKTSFFRFATMTSLMMLV